MTERWQITMRAHVNVQYLNYNILTTQLLGKVSQ